MANKYTVKWSDNNIENAILEVVRKAKITSFPTHSQMQEITGSEALSNAVSKHGGSRYWSKRLGLEMKKCESKVGFDFECECLHYLVSLGYDCELTIARYPYDLLANRNIKVDVKCSNLYHAKSGDFYTFNLEKKMPTCDVFVCYCVSEYDIEKTYVIPSCILSGITQLSIGKKNSKYDKYIDKWDIFARYDEFYKKMKQGS